MVIEVTEDMARDEKICNCQFEEHCVAQVYKISPGNKREIHCMELTKQTPKQQKKILYWGTVKGVGKKLSKATCI